jgi:ferrous iron transport protein B
MKPASRQIPFRAVKAREGIFIALAGNPNTGKTSLFNHLTGARQKVANYPGTTVERREGNRRYNGLDITFVDVPGLYSLEPKSPDERVACEVLRGGICPASRPQVVVCVVDGTNLERNLFLVLSIIETGVPVVVALNMMDEVRRRGMAIDTTQLSKFIGAPVVETVASKGYGVAKLLEIAVETARVAQRIDATTGIHARYEQIEAIVKSVVSTPSRHKASVRLDAVLLHRFAGPLVLIVFNLLIFQLIFSVAAWPMNLIDSVVAGLSGYVANLMPKGPLQSLVTDGIITGVGSILVFLPQILLLFGIITLLEDSGAMARAAFIMDRLMRVVGLSGRSFLPLLTSFACAIPGIMATRIIDDRKSRLVTIIIAPFMSCSARLPVYALMIGAFVPNVMLFGIFSLQAVTMLSMYVLGVVVAMAAALVFRRTLMRGKNAPFLIELPPYRFPSLRNAAQAMLSRGAVFVGQAGTIILAISIVLWFLASFPVPKAELAQTDRERAQLQQRLAAAPDPTSQQVIQAQLDTLSQREAQLRLEYSIAGRFGKAIEPAIAPLGFDWKIGIGLLTSFAAREVMVSTLATIYGVGDADETSRSLRVALRSERDPVTGRPTHTPLTAISLMVFFVLACQCMATVAVVKRETNSWKWPLLMVAYMTALAYLFSLAVYQIGSAMGWGR